MRLISLLSIGLVLLQACVVCTECLGDQFATAQAPHHDCCDHDHGPSESQQDSPSHDHDCQLHRGLPTFVPVAKVQVQSHVATLVTPVCTTTAARQHVQLAAHEGRCDCRDALAPTLRRHLVKQILLI